MERRMLPYQRWFGTFARGFISGAPDRDRQAIGLKLRHSQKVRGLSKTLALDLKLKEKDVFLAEICGLFHDIGRLPQFATYKTFVDARSDDHARLSVETLKKEGILNGLAPQEREAVLDAIFIHNKLSIPEDFEGIRLTLAQIVRDADKIDIWRVFDTFYRLGKGAEDINLGLPQGEDISADVMKDFLEGHIVHLEYVKNQLDFMVMRLSWLYDINFKLSLKIIVERNYIETIIQRLPEGTKREAIRKKISQYLQEKLGS
ncbi:MAG: HD domain-containing protein [Thermodesulfobacteria bacterium]|nr:HD domain-containing protein [Thermodesulfobacteriota bacterium]